MIKKFLEVVGFISLIGGAYIRGIQVGAETIMKEQESKTQSSDSKEELRA